MQCFIIQKIGNFLQAMAEQRNLDYNPFTLLGVGLTSNQDELRKAFRNKIKEAHPDKGRVKDDSLAKKLIEAYNAIKDADEERKKELAGVGGSSGDGNQVDISTCLMEKSLSEEFRRLFKAYKEFGSKRNFSNNFEAFYSSVFNGVERGEALRAGLECDICARQFVDEEHHFETAVCKIKTSLSY